MSKRASRRLFIRGLHRHVHRSADRGVRCARHQQFRLGRLPVFVENDQDGNALPGTEYVGYRPDAHVNPRMPARRCPKCGRPFPGAARSPDEGKRLAVGNVDQLPADDGGVDHEVTGQRSNKTLCRRSWSVVHACSRVLSVEILADDSLDA